MISCIIIEDEPLAMHRLEQFIQRSNRLKLLACFNDSEKGLEYLKNEKTDIAFVDVQMNQMTGIEIIKNFNDQANTNGQSNQSKQTNQTQFVITTAFSEYAVKGFDLNAVDYLLKPYSFERFEKAVEKIEIAIFKHNSEEHYINIPTGRTIERILVNDIIFIEGMRDYRRVHLAKSRIMTLLTFIEFEKMLIDSSIVRIHKSHMVHMKKVTTIESQQLWIGELQFKVSATYKNYI
jgi:two-component system LytT family response regulator